MDTIYKFSRHYEGEEYKFYLNKPSYPGEKGICGIEIDPYISVETPENGFGYPDTVLMNDITKRPYTLNRGLANWKLKKIGEQMKNLYEREILLA